MVGLNPSNATGRQEEAFNAPPLVELNRNSTRKATLIKSPNPLPEVTSGINFKLPDEEAFLDEKIIPENKLPSTDRIYNSYQQFNPGQFKENSPLWQMAMLHYLIDMKIHGHKIKEVAVDKVS